MRTHPAANAPAPNDSGPARALRWAVRATLAIAVLGFWPSLLDAFHAPKAIALRVLGSGLLAASLLDALRARFVRSARGAPRAPARALDVAALAIVAVAAASMLRGISPRLSWLGEIGQREGLATVLALAGVYAGVRRSHANAQHVRGTLAWIAGVLAACAADALLQAVGADPIAWAGADTYGEGVLRTSGTAGNPNLLGVLLAAALALATARVAQGGRAVAWAACAALVSAALVTTLSRGAWLAAVAGMAGAFALAFVAARDERRALGRGAALALAAGAVPALAVAIAQRGVVAARLTEDVGGAALSSGARLAIARGALALWRERPWLGVGPDAFGLAFPRVQPRELWAGEWIGLPAHAHSAALQVLATLGALGALALLGGLVAIAWGLANAWRERGEARSLAVTLAAAWIALLASGAVNVLGLGGAALAVVLAGLVACTVPPAEAESRETGGRAGLSNAAAVAALALGVVASAAWLPASWREWRALAAAGQARVALEQSVGAPAESGVALLGFAEERATRATDGLPREDELWRLSADVLQARARFAMAVADTQGARRAGSTAERAALAATEVQPLRASNHQRVGNAAAFAALYHDRGLEDVGRRASERDSLRAGLVAHAAANADSAFAKAERLAPMDALIRVDEARAALQIRRWDRALATAEAIVRLYPDMAVGHALMASAQMSRGDRVAAMAALRRALAARWEDGSEAQRDYARRLLRALESGVPAAH